MTIDLVFELIRWERQYQKETVDPKRRKGQREEFSVGDYLTLLRSYLNEADDTWRREEGKSNTMDLMRKIAAITVRCMEEHETPERIIEDGV